MINNKESGRIHYNDYDYDDNNTAVINRKVNVSD